MVFFPKIFQWMSQESPPGDMASSQPPSNIDFTKNNEINISSDSNMDKHSVIQESDEDSLSSQKSINSSSTSTHHESSNISTNSPKVSDEINSKFNVSEISVCENHDNENMTSIQKYKSTDSDGNMIGYEFHNMVLTGDNSVRGTDLFTVGSIWKDKKLWGILFQPIYP